MSKNKKEDSPIEDKPQGEVKQKNKNKNKNEELKTLFELVETSDLDKLTLILCLSRTGYLNQFYDEEDKYKENKYVEPSLTDDDFKKIIGG